MALMIDKENEFDLTDGLSQRIDADLRSKMKSTQNVTMGNPDPDLVEDSDYAKDFKKTSRFGWVWVVLILTAVVVAVAASVI